MTAVMEETLDGIDLDAVVPCHWWYKPCGKAALWRSTTRCCTHTTHLCTEHKETEQKLFEVHTRCDHLCCGVCGARPMPRPNWERI